MGHLHDRCERPVDAIDLYDKLGEASESDFVRARILGEHFKVIIADKSIVVYYRNTIDCQEYIPITCILNYKATKFIPPFVYHTATF